MTRPSLDNDASMWKLATVKLSSPVRERERAPDYDRDPARLRAVITVVGLLCVLTAGVVLIVRGLL